MTVDEVHWLRVLSLEPWGALLEGEVGLPRAHATARLRVGQGALVWVSRDERGRLRASMRLNDFVTDHASGLADGDPVSLVIGHRTDLGVNAVVNHRFWGLLYHDELFVTVRAGQRLDGWVLRVRADGKLDLTARPPGYVAVDPLTDRILDRLKAAGGFLPLTDRSAPQDVQRAFGVSKKQFKQAVGALYRRRRITLEEDGLRLVPGTEGQ